LATLTIGLTVTSLKFVAGSNDSTRKCRVSSFLLLQQRGYPFGPPLP